MSKSKTCKVCDYKQLEKDLAYLQVCVAAMGERLDALEAENARLRSMWGGVTHSGQPFWVGTITTSRDTITA